jgi:hypothetical protein
MSCICGDIVKSQVACLIILVDLFVDEWKTKKHMDEMLGMAANFNATLNCDFRFSNFIRTLFQLY